MAECVLGFISYADDYQVHRAASFSQASDSYSSGTNEIKAVRCSSTYWGHDFTYRPISNSTVL